MFLLKNKNMSKNIKKDRVMELQERYDELDNIVLTIRILVEDITDKEYIEQLEIIQLQAQEEIETIEQQLQKECDEVNKYQINEYFKSVL